MEEKKTEKGMEWICDQIRLLRTGVHSLEKWREDMVLWACEQRLKREDDTHAHKGKLSD